MSNTKTANHNTNGKADDEEKEVRKCDFEFRGSKIVLPEDMDLDEAAEVIGRQREEESVDVSISEPVNAFPFDGAVAMMKVLKRRYGWTHLIPQDMGFWGMKPPVMVAVEIGHGERIQVPWGNMSVPKIDGTLTTGYDYNNGMPCFKLTGTVKRKHERTVSQLADEIREEVRKASIYRFKAIKINFRDADGDRKQFDFNLCPKFIDLDDMGDTEPIFSKVVENAVRINIHNPIRFSARCAKKGASLKKGVLLGGPFGTGKTLAAFQAAKLCQEHRWTFLYLEDVRDLDLAIGFAKLYMPCLLFGEDVDKVTAGPRTPDTDRLLNTIDGVECKSRNDRLLMVLTTNNKNAINPAFLRPGRIDAVIEVTPPDEEACVRIVRKYVAEGGCKVEGTDAELRDAIKCLVGANAAFFRNTVEQAKLSAIENMASDDDDLIIRPADLKTVAEGMVAHCRLINPEHGQKSLLDLEGHEILDPLQAGFDILSQKFAEAFVDQITNPKVLKGIVVKARKGHRHPGGEPGNN